MAKDLEGIKPRGSAPELISLPSPMVGVVISHSHPNQPTMRVKGPSSQASQTTAFWISVGKLLFLPLAWLSLTEYHKTPKSL